MSAEQVHLPGWHAGSAPRGPHVRQDLAGAVGHDDGRAVLDAPLLLLVHRSAQEPFRISLQAQVERCGELAPFAVDLAGAPLPQGAVHEARCAPGAGLDVTYLRRIGEGTVTELILATGTSVEGEATAAYIKDRLAGRPVRVSRIASGVPIGGDLKYVDQVTLKRALDFRHSF